MFRVRQRQDFLRILEFEQAAGQVGMRIALEFQRNRPGTTLDPDFAAHDSLDAIVNLAALYVVMDSKGHGSSFHSPSFLNRLFTSFKWKSSEQSFSSSPFLKCLATSGSAWSCSTKLASSR